LTAHVNRLYDNVMRSPLTPLATISTAVLAFQLYLTFRTDPGFLLIFFVPLVSSFAGGLVVCSLLLLFLSASRAQAERTAILLNSANLFLAFILAMAVLFRAFTP